MIFDVKNAFQVEGQMGTKTPVVLIQSISFNPKWQTSRTECINCWFYTEWLECFFQGLS